MRCRDVDRLASAYVDGELEDALASALRGHLRTCEGCRDALEDTAAIVRAADTLDSLDPPPALWAAVQRGLAAAEVADAERSRTWLWWQRIRPQLLPATVIAAAAAALVLWIVGPADERAPVASTGAVGEVAESAPVAPALSVDEQLARERVDADSRYRNAIADLAAIAGAERATWSAEARRAFDDRVAAFEDAARRHRQALVPAGAAENVREPDSERAALSAVYQAQIRFMQAAVTDGPVLVSMAPTRGAR